MAHTVEEFGRMSSSAICDRSSVKRSETAIKKLSLTTSAASNPSRSIRLSRKVSGLRPSAIQHLAVGSERFAINANSDTDLISIGLPNAIATPLPTGLQSPQLTIPSFERVRLKVVVFGAPRVGKSTLIRQFMQNDGLLDDAYLPTKRREVFYPVAFTDERIYEMEIIDTCTLNVGNLFAYAKRNLTISLTADKQSFDAEPCDARASTAVCYLLVYDATNFESFLFIQRVRHHLLTLLSTVFGSNVMRHQSFDGDSFTQLSSVDIDPNNIEAPFDVSYSLGYRNGRYISMIVAANKFDVPHTALSLDIAALTQLPHSSSSNHLHRSRSLLRHRLRQLRELTAGRGDKDKEANMHHHFDAHHGHHHESHHHLHPYHNSHPSFTLSHPNGVEQSMSVSSSSTTQSQNISSSKIQPQAAQLIDEYVRKSWRVTHVDVSAKRNYHVSMLFREIIRDFELRQADERNHLLHTSSRFESALRSRFSKKSANAGCVML